MIQQVQADRVGKIDAFLRQLVDEHILVGVVAHVQSGGAVLLDSAHGMAYREGGVPMQPDTLFRLWSCTKWITAVAALLRYEEGRFALDQDIADFLPEYRDTPVYRSGDRDEMLVTARNAPITIRQLLTHTSGMGVDLWTNLHPVNQQIEALLLRLLENHADLAEVNRALAAVPLKAQPGTRWAYSLSLEAVARLVEVVSGMPYAAFLQQRVFEPLGMADTTFKVSEAQLPRFSALYERSPHRGEPPVLLEAPENSPDFLQTPIWTPGSFGLVSTVPDFARLLAMQANGGLHGGQRLLGSHTVSLMMTNHLPPDLLPCHFEDSSPLYGYGHGLGVHVLMDRGLAGVPFANGEVWKDGGCGTLGWIDPSNGVTGVLMFQLNGHWVHHIFSRFRALVYQALDA